jgi:hypothetical protein
VVTPTYYWNLREESSTELNTNFNTGAPIDLETVITNNDYQLTTPLRLSGGLAVFAGKRGFVSADVEYITYNSARLNSRVGDDFTADNEESATATSPR